MTYELIFAVVTAVVTGLLGAILKDRVVPSRFIPIQNIVIGVVAGLFAVYFNLFDNVAIAIFTSLATALGVGGAYDVSKTTKEEQTTFNEDSIEELIEDGEVENDTIQD